jgi:predicted negative regulator of RcsB-dependent stress response
MKKELEKFYAENKIAILVAVILILLAILGRVTENDPHIW